MLSAELRDAESGPYFFDDRFRESQQVIFARPVQNSDFSPGTLFVLPMRLSQF
jgi:hypothetical protein